MNINGTQYHQIGLIRPRPLGKGRFLLVIHPPQGWTTMPVTDTHGLSYVAMAECVVSANELAAMKRKAPHLFAKPVLGAAA